MSDARPVPVALTIAGSDSGGGAGIQADLKTFQALGVYGMSALTAVTAQNTSGVVDVLELPPALVAAQMDAVLDDIGADAAKTGMLAAAPIIEAVAASLRRHGLTKVVVDPVMVAKSGDRLLRQDAVTALRTVLLPLALIVTPNVPEAEVLAGRRIASLADAEAAARRIHDLGPGYVVVKGGHLEGDATDVAFDGEQPHRLEAPRLDRRHTHGTGCTFSAAIAAGLAKGQAPLTAIREAKQAITRAIEHGLSLGHGTGPTNHFVLGD